MAQIKMTRDNQNFQRKLSSIIENKRGCDVEVIFGQERIPAHSIVLGANSGYFERYLLKAPKVPKKFVLKGVDTHITKQIIQYCCTGNIEIMKDDLIKILKHAHFLDIRALIEFSVGGLKKMMNSDNCIHIWKLAKSLGINELLGTAAEYIKNITGELLSQPKKTLVAIGGFSNNQYNIVERFDKKTDTWITTEVKLDREWFRSIFIENKVLVIGGHNGRTPLANVECFDPKQWRKTTLSPMKVARCVFAAVKVGTSVFVMGGDFYNKSLSSVERYDLTTGQWSPIESMPTARSHNQAVAIDGKIYVIGGSNYGTYFNVNECYSVSARTWETRAPMLQIRSSPGAAVHKGMIYVVGGYDGSCLSTVERYDPKLDKWTYIQSLPYSCFSLAAEIFENHLVVSGGWDGNKYLSTVRQYDFDKDVWTPLPPLNVAHCHHNMLLVPTNLFD